MGETRTVHDPFLGKDVQVSNRLTDRLRGKYASGPTLPSGEPEFGYRQFETPPIQREAADVIDALEKALEIFLLPGRLTEEKLAAAWTAYNMTVPVPTPEQTK